jgi:hypothetical protein
MGIQRPRVATWLAGMAALSYLLLAWHFLAQAQDAAKAPEGKKEAVDEKSVRALVTQLGDESFEKREAAHKRLAALGEQALPLLQKAAKETADLEVRTRLGELIQAIHSSLFVEVRSFGRHKNWVTRLAVTPDGQKVVAALRGGSLRCWNVADGKELLFSTGKAKQAPGDLAFHRMAGGLLSAARIKWLVFSIWRPASCSKNLRVTPLMSLEQRYCQTANVLSPAEWTARCVSGMWTAERKSAHLKMSRRMYTAWP